jgi:hypothetical protein
MEHLGQIPGLLQWNQNKQKYSLVVINMEDTEASEEDLEVMANQVNIKQHILPQLHMVMVEVVGGCQIGSKEMVAFTISQTLKTITPLSIIILISNHMAHRSSTTNMKWSLIDHMNRGNSVEHKLTGQLTMRSFITCNLIIIIHTSNNQWMLIMMSHTISISITMRENLMINKIQINKVNLVHQDQDKKVIPVKKEKQTKRPLAQMEMIQSQ